jgi:hypothetical protein
MSTTIERHEHATVPRPASDRATRARQLVGGF